MLRLIRTLLDLKYFNLKDVKIYQIFIGLNISTKPLYKFIFSMKCRMNAACATERKDSKSQVRKLLCIILFFSLDLANKWLQK